MIGVFIGILIGIFVGVAGAIVYRNNEKRAWRYAISTVTAAKQKAEFDAVAVKRRIDGLVESFKNERENLIKSLITSFEEALAKPETELKAAVEALLVKAKSIL